VLAKGVFWGSAAAILWTHAGYPAAAAALARLRPRPVARADVTPSVSLVVAAHDEEASIAARLENALALDYPADRLEVVVASDASTDRTDEIVEEIAAREPRVRLVRCPRGGKLAAINHVWDKTGGEILAFSDATSRWERDALRKLVRSFADPDVGYVSGQLQWEQADGTSREGVYWRYENWLRASESALGSITGGIGPIYAVRRRDFVAQPYGQDAALPALMAQRGRRAVFDPEAVARERPAGTMEAEYGRKARMFAWAWYQLFEGSPTRGVDPLFRAEWFSHRVLRYSSGLLHVALLAASLRLAGRGRVYETALAAQLAWLSLAAAGRLRAPVPGATLAYYYLLVTWATVVGLVRYLRTGVPRVWEQAEGTR
jgi:cellulose synthase/poly-beta-1,6-N-acetylglucosamine synthase-like glycosyltransferase